MYRTLLCASFLVIGGPAPAAELPYKVGVAAVDITPAHPIRLNGFGFRRAESEGVYQKIRAKALAVEGADHSPVVLMTVDVLGIPADIYDRLARRLEKSAGLKPGRLAVTATHTHTGPMLSGANPTIFGTPIPKEHLANIDRYTPVFIDRLEAAALAALKDMKPARLEWGVGKVTFAVNRRKKEIAPTDHDLPVLFVKGEQGTVRAIYLNYACHCVTLSQNKIGGDWAGYAAAAIEDMFPGAFGLVGIGCGADQNPNSGVTGAKEEVAAAQGREIAAEVKRLSQQALAPVSGPISSKMHSIDLPLADLPTREQWEEKAKQMNATGHHARVTLAKLDSGEKLPTQVDYPVQTWAFGDSMAMVFLPGEVVVDYALRLKKVLDGRRVWVTAYANNAPCYIPSERVLKEGGYEGGGAMIYYDLPGPFKPGLEDKIVTAAKDQIGKPFGAKFDPDKTGGSLPLSPHQSLTLIRTKPGLRVDLVAAEPLVADPVAIAFGPDGKVWVAEMADYPLGRTGHLDPGGRVVVLEDIDDDGKLDKSTLFLDRLPFPTGVLPWRKGVLVCAAPDILYAEDTDGDGRADKVMKLYSGFGTNNYQARVNSLQYGLDGWVYGSCGLFGGDIMCHKTGKTVHLGDRDFRIKPDTGELEPATGRTQQGRVRDDRGNWFGCDNGSVVRHYALDDHYLRRNPFVAFPDAVVPIAASSNPKRLYSLNTHAQRFALSGPPNNVTAACGLGIYRDELLGTEYTGDSFTCEPVNLLVHRRKLKANGVTFTAVRAPDESASEFLASTDPWFRPVQATTGPDGGLWVADMYRFLIEHPRWIPQADLARIDVRAGAGLGRLYRVRPADKPLRPWPRLDKLDTAELVAALNSPNGWQRDMAMMMLVWQNDPAAAELLKQFLANSRGVPRLQALCTLGVLGQSTSVVIESALADPEPATRAHAVRLTEPYLAANEALAAKVVGLVNDTSPHVRLQVAYSLGAWDHPRGGIALARIAVEAAQDPQITAAAMSSLNAKNLASFASAVFETSGKDGPPPRVVRDLLASATGIDNGSSLTALLKTVTKSAGGVYQPWQMAAVAGTLDALERRGLAWENLPGGIRAVVAPVVVHARELIAKDDGAEPVVIAAVPLLGRERATRADDIIRLAGLTTAARPAAVQTAAVAALGRIPDAAVPPTLAAAWTGASPALRNRILDALLARPAWLPQLLAAVEKGTMPAGQFDAGRRQRLVNNPEPAIRARAEKLFSGGTNRDRQKVIDAYKAALMLTGDKTRGKAAFAKTCSACHVLDGVGHAVGPDLSALANKSPLYLLSEILDPNRNLDSRYAEYQATLKDGRTVSGVLAAETATAITLRGQQGKEEIVLRTDLENLRGTAKSLMPEGLEKDLPAQAVADLLAYLSATDHPAKKIPGNDPAELAMAGKSLTLPAAKAFVYGDQITFEPQFRNIGLWHGEKDHVVWRVRLDKAAEFDVYIDFACAHESAGNTVVVEGAEPALRGKITATGGWDRYTLCKMGTVKLTEGSHRIVVRPDGPVKGALLDLRTVYLVPVGTVPTSDTRKPEELIPPQATAKLILDESAPRDRREVAAKDAAERAGSVLRAMTADLPTGDSKEEYRRIPWVWRVAIAAGRANDADVLLGVLEVALPNPGQPLRDWQAVVLGGGVVNGLSLEGVWPGRRMAELLHGHSDIEVRWRAVIEQARTMAADTRVPTGTRYDALRIVALDDWEKARPVLAKHLAKSAVAELQMGAVSGLVDVERPEAAALLVTAIPALTTNNRKLAIAGSLRTPDRVTMLLGAVEKGIVKAAWIGKEHREALLTHPDQTIRARAAKLLGQ